MGLDMYLSKKTYVKNWDHYKPEERFAFTITRGGQEFTGINKDRISYIEEQVMYWRKANAIHKWFVDNVQNGTDDCGDYYVDLGKLEGLLELVSQVLKNKKRASELLPSQDGFFFGGTEYDEWYWDNMKRTKEELTAILAEEGDGDFYYHSSW
jgi:hypothetical protein